MADEWLSRLAADNAVALRSYLRQFSRNPADIEDWLQEALLRVFAASRSGELSQARAYLFRTARNVALNRIAHRKVKHQNRYELELQAEQRLADKPMHQLLQNYRDKARLLRAIAVLPPCCREVFMMAKIEGYSHKEIAEKRGISVSTVEKHLSRGLKLCRVELMRESEDMSQKRSTGQAE